MEKRPGDHLHAAEEATKGGEGKSGGFSLPGGLGTVLGAGV